MSESRNTPDGLWDACVEMEFLAVQQLSAQLHLFEAPIKTCYELGVQVPTLPGKRNGTPDQRLAALFLKRVLTDLRSVWLLILRGYTFEAASIAATLFEHALTVSCIAGSPQRVQELSQSGKGDVPWSPVQLSKMYARKCLSRCLKMGEPFPQTDYEIQWREIYSAYKYLCKIKHPTLRSTIFNAGSSSIRSNEFVVMAVPDLRKEDISLKATILMVSISRCYDAIVEFGISLETNENSEVVQDFLTRMSTLNEQLIHAFKATCEGLPFTIRDEPLATEYALLKIEQQDQDGTTSRQKRNHRQ